MAEAEPVIRAALPDANVPTLGAEHRHSRGARTASPSCRRRSMPWLDEHDDGIACVIIQPTSSTACRSAGSAHPVRSLRTWRRASSSTSSSSSTPGTFGAGIEGAVDRYVAMTRATQRLVVLSGRSADGPGSVDEHPVAGNPSLRFEHRKWEPPRRQDTHLMGKQLPQAHRWATHRRGPFGRPRENRLLPR